MPVVTIAAPAHPDEAQLLGRVADAVADALGLGPGDVVAMSIPARTTVASGGQGVASPPWTVIGIHGSDRGAVAMRRACDAAHAVAADWNLEHDGDLEGVWCEWLLPQRP